MKLTLNETQARFKAILKAVELPDSDPIGIKKQGALGPLERFEVYRSDYVSRLEESIAEDFPRVRAALGEERFEGLVQDYLAAHPSHYCSLAQLSEAFPAFVAKTGDIALGDLAQYEFLRCLCLWSEFPSAKSFTELAELTDDEQLAQILELAPTHFLMESDHRPHEEAYSKGPRSILVIYKSPIRTECLELSAQQKALFDSIRAGRTLSDILAAVPMDPRWLSDWSAQGLIVGFHGRLSPGPRGSA